MKKTAICLMAALGMTAVSLTSCDSSCKPVKELANASDSLVYAVGVLTGNRCQFRYSEFRATCRYRPIYKRSEKSVVQ